MEPGAIKRAGLFSLAFQTSADHRPSGRFLLTAIITLDNVSKAVVRTLR
jgi:hypothetical protein